VFVNNIAPLLAKRNLTIDENPVLFADGIGKLHSKRLIWFDVLIANEDLRHWLPLAATPLSRHESRG